jgi:hypothetical protein
MLRRSTEFLERHATGRRILASIALSVVFGVIPLNYAVARIRAVSPDAAPLDMAMSYTPDEAYTMIARYGADARHYYVFNAFTFDAVGPALFGLTIALMSTALLARLTAPGSLWRAAAVIGPVAGLAVDLVENALLATLVSRFPERLDTVAMLANVATMVKRTVIFGTWALVLFPAIVLGVRALLKPKAQAS